VYIQQLDPGVVDGSRQPSGVGRRASGVGRRASGVQPYHEANFTAAIKRVSKKVKYR
jgi:hypothetical protein